MPPPPPPQAAAPKLSPKGIEALIRAIAQEEGFDDPDFAVSIAEQESSLGQNLGPSTAGARGIMQLMPATAAKWKVNIDDPADNVRGGIRELKALQAEHKNDLHLVARRYNGSPRAGVELTDRYVRDVFSKYRIRKGLPAAKPGEDTDGRIVPEPGKGAAPASPFSASSIGPGGVGLAHALAGRAPEGGPFSARGLARWALHKIGLDPFTAEDRPNIGGTTGAFGGAGLGFAVAGPWGMIPGAIIGAFGGGAGSQAYNEATGVPPPPRPTDIPEEGAAGRIFGAGMEQAAWETAGQGLALPGRQVAKTAVQDTVSRGAREAFDTGRRAATEAATRNLDVEVARQRAEKLLQKDQQVALGNTLRGRREAAAAEVERARQLADEAVRGARGHGEGLVGAAKQWGDIGIAQTQAEVEAAQRALRESYQYGRGRPGFGTMIPAGEAVGATVEGPVLAGKELVGRAVREAADSGPFLDIRNTLKTEARRIGESLMPGPMQPARRPVPGRRQAARPYTYDQLMGELGAAQFDEIKKHPIMGMLAKIHNAPNVVSFRQLHDWKEELQRLVNYDPKFKTQIEGLFQHLTGEVRDTLRRTNHAPYEKATAEYKQLMDLFERGRLDDVREYAEKAPEKIAQLISPDNPSQAAALMQILKERAAKGGGEAGQRQGGEAARAVQRAWFDRNILSGDIDQLETALQTLNKNPEFTRMFLGDAHGQDMLRNTREIANAWAETLAREAEQVGIATRAKAGSVEAAQQRAREVLEATQSAADASVRSAQGKQAGVKAGTRTEQQAFAKATRERGAEMAAKMDELRRARQLAGQPTAEELAFYKSTLSPEHLAKTRRSFLQLIKAGIVGTVGYKGMGPAGMAASLLIERSQAKASGRDLLKYAVHSPATTRFIVNHLAVSSKPGTVLTAGMRPIIEAITTLPPPPAVAAGRGSEGGPGANTGRGGGGR